jgi:hypothetical protein
MGSLSHDNTRPQIGARKNSIWKFPSILCTVPTVHQVIITFFSISRNFCQARDWVVIKKQAGPMIKKYINLHGD